ncbi:MAG TPA: GAF domain-containing protein, partial [Hellea balneolensis]|nr:GAF domain-containing protein [Hellea balneolensis]
MKIPPLPSLPLKPDPGAGLLKRIRALMASETDVQTRLDNFVKLISQSMKINVCSIYLRSGDELELCATKGLKQEAVHNTRMRLDEGLVGLVARSARLLNLAKAPEHPEFSYRPETGEEKFNSFLGVPLLRGGRNLGVLVVQNKKAREYTESEVENLLTAATLLAEIAIEDERTGGKTGRIKGIRLTPTGPETIKGQAFADGLAQGRAVFHVPPVAAGAMIASNTAEEQARLEKAIRQLRRSVDAMIDGKAAGLNASSREIFESYRLFAYDRKWVGRLREAVHSGLTAEAAVERVRNEHRARMLKARDPYLRARL